MDKRELDNLIQQGEGFNVEFKEDVSDNLGREICAFANANGGKILIGIADNGTIKGVRDANRKSSQIQDTARNLDPHFQVFTDTIGNVIVVTVPEGTNKPYSVNGKFFVRYGSNSQQLSRNEIREFFEKEGLILFDEKPNYDFHLENDFDVYKFRTFLEKAKITEIIDRKEMLNNLNLIKDNRLKNAGVLLFCHRVTKFFFQATISCVLYEGTTKYKILDKKEYDADLYSNFQNALLYLRSHLNTEYIIKGGPREEKLELPEEALREALLNSIAHRDYAKQTSILVEIFSDRVVITNPGGLVKGINRKDLGKKSFSRNNLLFGLLQRMGLVEKVGSGIARIRKSIKEYGLPSPKFETDENWFSLIFKRKSQKETTQKTTQKTTQIILDLIGENPSITRKELSENIGITEDGIKYNLNKLRKEGKLKRIGSDKGGHWEVVKE